MKKSIRRLVFFVLSLAGTSALFAAEPTPGFSRKILIEQDLTTAGKRGAIALIEFAPGAARAKTHPPR